MHSHHDSLINIPLAVAVGLISLLMDHGHDVWWVWTKVIIPLGSTIVVVMQIIISYRKLKQGGRK